MAMRFFSTIVKQRTKPLKHVKPTLSPSSNIHRYKIPYCDSCKYYIPNPHLKTNTFGQCTLFTSKYITGVKYSIDNSVNNKIYSYTYIPCILARNDDSLCGKYGKFYAEK
jgi:hypothetical protein